MKNKIFITIIIVLAVVAVAIWYFAFFSIKPEPTQTSQDNSAGTTSKKEKPPSDSKYATLKGDAFDEAYIADMLAHHEGALNGGETLNLAQFVEHKGLILLHVTCTYL